MQRMCRLDTWHCHSSTVPVRGKGVWGDGKSGCRTQGQRRGLGPITC